MSPKKQMKAARRTGPILFATLVLLAGAADARAHPPATGTSMVDANGTIHSCYQDILPIFARRLRVVADTEPCLLTLTIGPIPITLPLENGVDWPANGVLTRLVESPPPAVPLTLPAGVGQTGSVNLTCPPDKVAIGLSEFTNTVATAPALMVGIDWIGTPTGNTYKVTFVNMTGTAAKISDLAALCVTLFTQ